MKCPHCERRFRPDASKSYTALSTRSDQTVKAFTAMDCPRCGGQILLGHRYPKSIDFCGVSELDSGEVE